ncbi:MAG: PSD1 and planctomycete cytochrome C domain-containing protein [Pirellulales bacterium]
MRWPGRIRLVLSLLVLAASLLQACSAQAADPAQPEPPKFDAAALEFFESHVRPILVERCHECHGPDTQEAGLRLDARSTIERGGDSGPAIVPGKPDQSLLVDAVNYGDIVQMPPRSKLPADEIATLTRWVAMGAPWPAESDVAAAGGYDEFNLAERAQHWSFQPVREFAPPDAQTHDWPGAPIDRFILARLEEAGIAPAPPADKRTLIRRVTFDLVGLPPTPEEIDAFLADASPDAFARVVDRLLASPHYGERWARHWLDLVRYAATCGHEFDYAVPHAYRYRDYVIRALNADVPYDQFLTEHLAGDLLPDPRRHPVHDYNESILGTGFLFLGERTHAPVDVAKDEAERVNNQIDVVSKTFLGLTVACARCHDHKFDPIRTDDFYALAGYLKSSRMQEALLDPHQKIATAAGQLRQLRDEGTALLRDVAASTDLTGDKFARYLLAASEVIGAEQNDAGSAAVARLAEKYELDAPQLTRVSQTLRKAAANDVQHPLHAWQTLTAPADDKGFARRRARLLKESPGAGSSSSDLNGWFPRKHRASPKIFEDFSDGYDGWFVTGDAFGDGPTQPGQWAVSESKLALATPGIADSGAIAPRLQGVLRSPTFRIERPRIDYRLAGKKGRVRLIIDSYVMDVYSRLLFEPCIVDVDTDGQFRWHRQNVSKYVGHRAHIELIDHGDGYVAVDEIRFTDERPLPKESNPVTAAVLASPEVQSPEELAGRYAALWDRAIARWSSDGAATARGDKPAVAPGGQQLSSAHSQLINWALASGLVEETDATRTQARRDKPAVAPGFVAPAAVAPGVESLDVSAVALVEETGTCAARLDQLRTRVGELDAALPEPMLALAAADGTGQNERVHIRGSHVNLGREVARRPLEVSGGLEHFAAGQGSGRLELARRWTDPAHPLVARVMVNRLWQHHFGAGLVATPDNFGIAGQPPSHPELLDYLAGQFIRDGWSLKQMHRRMLLSSAYQMSSRGQPASEAADPTNRLLHRVPVRRLEAEAVRDAVLTVSGRLDRTMFGPGVLPHLTPFMTGRGRPESGPLDGKGRRSLYVEVRRNFLSPMLLAFDFPQPFSTVGRRSVSNVPAQALTLLNDPLVIEQARLWASRITNDANTSDRARIERMYLEAFSRPPTGEETDAAVAFLQSQSGQYEHDGQRRAWEDLAHVLMNVKEFIFIQ